MKNTKHHYPGVDLVKFLMAVVVISIHTLPGDFFSNPISSGIYDFLCTNAVPFFFVSSGFLLAQRADRGTDGLKDAVVRSLKKFLKMYVLWMLIYSPLAIWDFYRSGRGLVTSILLYVHGFLLLGEHYNSWPLWYLLSTLYGLGFLYLLGRKKLPVKHIALCGVIAFLFGSALSCLFDHADLLPGPLSSLAALMSKVIFPGRILNGFHYMSMGMLAYHCRFSNKMGIFFMALSGLSLLVQNELLGITFRLFSGLGIFVLAANVRGWNKPVFPLLRKLSTVMYFLHMYVWTFYYAIVYGEKTFGADSFLATTAVCIVLGLAYHFIPKRSSVKTVRA